MDFNSFISGFVEGEGCFCTSFNRRAKMKTGVEIRPSFSISQNKRNLPLFKLIHEHFGCGGIRFSKKDQSFKYEIRSIKEIAKVIIPFFDKNPLMGIKKDDFVKFKEICLMIYQNEHLNPGNLNKIIDLAYSMNYSGKRKYKKEELLKHVAR